MVRYIKKGFLILMLIFLAFSIFKSIFKTDNFKKVDDKPFVSSTLMPKPIEGLTANANPGDLKEPEIISKDEKKNLENKKRTIASKLLAKIRELSNEDVSKTYEMLMLLDASNGVLKEYKELLSKEDLEFVEKKSQNIKKQIGSFPIYSGYSPSGLHVLGLTKGFGEFKEDVLNVIPKVRNDEQETKLLWESNNATYNKATLVDLFIEDLSGVKSEVEIYPYITNGSVTLYPKLNNDPNLIEYLKGFNRSIDGVGGSRVQRVGSWKLYMFDQEMQNFDITIQSGWEEFKLSKIN